MSLSVAFVDKKERKKKHRPVYRVAAQLKSDVRLRDNWKSTNCNGADDSWRQIGLKTLYSFFTDWSANSLSVLCKQVK